MIQLGGPGGSPPPPPGSANVEILDTDFDASIITSYNLGTLNAGDLVTLTQIRQDTEGSADSALQVTAGAEVLLDVPAGLLPGANQITAPWLYQATGGENITLTITAGTTPPAGVIAVTVKRA
jgi:hypothetical protein